MDLLSRIAAIALVVTFTWAGIAKVVWMRDWGSALRRHGLPRPIRVGIAVGVPAAELAVAVVFAFASIAVAGALSLALIAAFSLALVRARGFEGDDLPCACFGRAKVRDYRLLVLRNALLAIAAAVAAAGSTRPLLDDVNAPDSSDLVPATLVMLGLVVAVWAASHITELFRRRP